MSKEFLKPGQCKITSFAIIKNNNVILQTNQLLEFFSGINIYENIFTPFMSAELFLVDGSSLVEKYNLSGDEDFEIEFVGYGNNTPLKYKFKFVEHINLIPAPNNRSRQHSFRLVSEELLNDSSTSIAKSYDIGTKEIVEDIIKNYLKSTKSIFVESVKSVPLIVLPYLSPSQALDFLRQRVVSDKYKSSSFLFFENSKGFVFSTAEGLVDKDNKNIPTFFQRESITEDVKSYRTDLDAHHLFFNYTVQSPFDLNSTFKNGGLRTNLSQYDMTTKEYKNRVFFNDPSKSIFVDSTSNKNPLLSKKVFDKYSSNSNKPLLIPFAKYKDTNNPTSNFIFDTAAERLCFSSLFTQKLTFVDIPGNTLLGAGSIINLNVPTYNGNLEGGKDNINSGTYLISSCKHSINVTDTAKYDTHLELMRLGRGVFEQ